MQVSTPSPIANVSSVAGVELHGRSMNDPQHAAIALGAVGIERDAMDRGDFIVINRPERRYQGWHAFGSTALIAPRATWVKAQHVAG